MKEFDSGPTPPPFGVEQFPSEPNQDLSLLGAINEIVAKYPEYNDPIGEEKLNMLVERQMPDGAFRAYIQDVSIVTRFVDSQGSETSHRYFQGVDGNMHRLPLDFEEMRRGIPTSGAAPDSLVNEMLDEKGVEESQVARLQLEMGEDHLVGKPELEYLMGNIKESEPATFRLSAIVMTALRRIQSPIKPSEEESRQAAENFEKQVDTFLQRNSQDPNKPQLHVTMPSEDGSRLDIQTGRSPENIPFVTLRFNGDAGFIFDPAAELGDALKGAKFDISYFINQGRFVVGMTADFTDEIGTVIGGVPKAYSLADRTEVRGIRNFLRKPSMAKRGPKSDTTNTDTAETE